VADKPQIVKDIARIEQEARDGAQARREALLRQQAATMLPQQAFSRPSGPQSQGGLGNLVPPLSDGLGALGGMAAQSPRAVSQDVVALLTGQQSPVAMRVSTTVASAFGGWPQPQESVSKHSLVGLYAIGERYRIYKHVQIAFHKEHGHWPEAIWMIHGPTAFAALRSGRPRSHSSARPRTSIILSDFVEERIKGHFIMKHRIVVLLHRALRREQHEDFEVLIWPNGERYYLWHGWTMDPFVVLRPHSICMRHIRRENNVELKRILIERE